MLILGIASCAVWKQHFFQTILQQHEEIGAGLQQQQEMLRERGYTPLIAAKEK
ncbi:hypothetical protein GCM10020331_045410 [Ectobacillus funiculus]